VPVCASPVLMQPHFQPRIAEIDRSRDIRASPPLWNTLPSSSPAIAAFAAEMGLMRTGGWRRPARWLVSELGRLEKSWKRLVPADKSSLRTSQGGPSGKKLETLFARGSMVPVWIKANARGAGHETGIRQPDQLGPTAGRAVGAWSILARACLVVTAGTATTVDVLRGRRQVCRGVILPGLELMKRSLAGNTAGLPFAAGRFPRPRQYCGCHRDRLPARASRGDRTRFRDEWSMAQHACHGGARSPDCPHLSVPCGLWIIWCWRASSELPQDSVRTHGKSWKTVSRPAVARLISGFFAWIYFGAGRASTSRS